MSSVRGSAGRSRLWVSVAVLSVVGLLAVLGWYFFGSEPSLSLTTSDPAVLQANNRGIGFMEQFEYEKAAAAFEEAVRREPDWLPGHINLGIALMNSDQGDNRSRARQLFEQMLERIPGKGQWFTRRRRDRQIFDKILQADSDNPYAH